MDEQIEGLGNIIESIQQRRCYPAFHPNNYDRFDDEYNDMLHMIESVKDTKQSAHIGPYVNTGYDSVDRLCFRSSGAAVPTFYGELMYSRDGKLQITDAAIIFSEMTATNTPMHYFAHRVNDFYNVGVKQGTELICVTGDERDIQKQANGLITGSRAWHFFKDLAGFDNGL
jgi:hypothetical protein